MNKIFITGITGQQGSATAMELVQKGYKVTGLTRSPQSSTALHLQKAGIGLIQGDIEDDDAIRLGCRDAEGMFLVLPPVWESSAETDRKEAELGIRILQIAQEESISFVLYSSVLGADFQAAFRPYFKHTIEQHLLKSSLSGAILRPASFFENLLLPSFGLATRQFINPLPAERAIPYVSTKDIGTFARIIFEHHSQFNGKIVDFGAQMLSPDEIVQLLKNKLEQDISCIQVPLELIYQQSETFGKLVNHIQTYGYDSIDYNFIHQWMPKLMTMKEWLEEHGVKKIKELQRLYLQT